MTEWIGRTLYRGSSPLCHYKLKQGVLHLGKTTMRTGPLTELDIKRLLTASLLDAPGGDEQFQRELEATYKSLQPRAKLSERVRNVTRRRTADLAGK